MSDLKSHSGLASLAIVALLILAGAASGAAIALLTHDSGNAAPHSQAQSSSNQTSLSPEPRPSQPNDSHSPNGGNTSPLDSEALIAEGWQEAPLTQLEEVKVLRTWSRNLNCSQAITLIIQDTQSEGLIAITQPEGVGPLSIEFKTIPANATNQSLRLSTATPSLRLDSNREGFRSQIAVLSCQGDPRPVTLLIGTPVR